MQTTNICAAAAVRLTMRYPFWSEVYFSMTVKEVEPDHAIKTAATDGRTLWVNPVFWKGLTLDEQVFLCAHELGHKIFLHCTRQGARDPELWNIACDYVINAMLKDNGFTMPQGGLYDPQYAGWLAEAVYADLDKKQKANPKSRPTLSPGQRDIVAQKGSPEQVDKHETEVKALVERAIANAKAMGKLPAGIEAGVVDIYKASREPWYNALHRYMQSLSTSEYNWARLNRRTLRSHGCFTPLHLSEALGEIALFIDTSGSCYDRASQVNFAGHLNAILAEARPHRVHLYYFDARVYPGEVIEAGELDITTRPKGGGGTSFIPIFEAVEKDGLNPELVIILTDTQGSFPSTIPSYPVLWASIDESGSVPFGDIIYVE